MLVSHSFSIEERSGDLAGQGNTFTFYGACWVTTGYEGARYPVGKHPLNDDYKWQCNSLNHQTDVQVCSRGV
ncbi:uncharacterized protein TNCV_4090161 [Trichonephila clavipes]|uniref:Uncharacterized protein n=1 Tax=Trichonephila clavipes TaxID=2585209 RepID=A0A8X6S4Y8_TRICX|nr:uncharacterized protein TNCV_4090161 [Trichonephila clavipes]